MKNLCIILLILLLISGVIHVITWMNGKEDSLKADLKVSTLKNEKDQVNAKLDSLTASGMAERKERAKNDSVSEFKVASLTGALNASKQRERRSRPDSAKKTLVDTVYAEYDTLLAVADHRRVADSLSFEKEMGTLAAKNLELNAWSSKLYTNNLDLINTVAAKDKKISKLKAWLLGLGISTTAVTIILALVIAL